MRKFLFLLFFVGSTVFARGNNEQIKLECHFEPWVSFDSSIPSLIVTYNQNGSEEKFRVLSQDGICGARYDLANCQINSSKINVGYSYSIACEGDLVFTLELNQTKQVVTQVCNPGKPYGVTAKYLYCF